MHALKGLVTEPDLRHALAHPENVPAPAAQLHQDVAGTGDPLSVGSVLAAISDLIEAIGCTMGSEHETAEECMRQACAVLLAGAAAISSPAQLRCSGPDVPRSVRCSLAPWQIRRLTTHIETNLSEPIRCEDLARLVRLSLSHFIRAFKAAFGHPPHTFLIRRRFERAQGLMLTTDLSLGEIAQECGLADQSHLSRIFQRFAGESPGAWRRAREVREFGRARPLSSRQRAGSSFIHAHGLGLQPEFPSSSPPHGAFVSKQPNCSAVGGSVQE